MNPAEFRQRVTGFAELVRLDFAPLSYRAQELHHEKEAPKPGLVSISSRPVSVGTDSHPKLRSSADTESSAAIRSWSRSSEEMTPAPAAQGVSFKKCCMRKGRYDGSLRDHYF